MINYPDIITTVCTVIQAFAVVISLYFVVLQLSQSNKTRKVELLREIINEIGSDTIRELRKTIFSDKTETELEIDDIRKIAVAYDRISFMLMCDKKIAIDFYKFQGKEVIKLWSKIQIRIEKYRVEIGNQDYCIHFEELNKYYTKLSNKRN